MEEMALFDKFTEVATDKEWEKLRTISRCLFSYFSSQTRRNILTHMLEAAEDETLSQEKKALLAKIFYSLIFNSHKVDDILTPYDSFKKFTDDTFALDRSSEEFEKRYSVLRLFSIMTDADFFQHIILEHLETYRGVRFETPLLRKLYESIAKREASQRDFLLLFDALLQIDVDIAPEMVLYIWAKEKKERKEALQHFFRTFDTSMFTERYLDLFKDADVANSMELAGYYLEFLHRYMKDKDIIQEKVVGFLESYYSLHTKLDFIQSLSKTPAWQIDVVRKSVDDFIRNIPQSYSEIFKEWDIKEESGKRVIRLFLYKDDPELEWERGKYSHRVISYSDDLKRHPKYKEKFPYFIWTEGGGYDTVYYTQLPDVYVPSSSHFTSLENAVIEQASKDLRSLGIVEDVEIVLPV